MVLIVVVVLVVGAGAYYLGTQKSGVTPPVQSPPLSSSITLSPEEVVKTFYSTWIDCEGEYREYSLKIDKVPEEIFQKKEQCIRKDFDNYTVIQKEQLHDNSEWCAQDFPSKIEVDKADILGNTAVVLSHHMFESGDNAIKVNLVLINNSWKISDTTCPPIKDL